MNLQAVSKGNESHYPENIHEFAELYIQESSCINHLYKLIQQNDTFSARSALNYSF